MSHKTFVRVSPDVVSSFKLDASFYQSEFLDLDQAFATSSVRIANLKSLRLPKDGYKYGTNDPSQEDYPGVPIITIPNISNSRIRSMPLKWCSQSPGTHTVATGDLLLVRSNGNRNLTGRSALVTDRSLGHAYASFLIRVRLKHSNVDAGFVTAFMNSRAGRIQRRRFANGTNLFNVNMEELDHFKVPQPSLTTQRFVGGKLRLAEQLEEIARRIQFGATRLLADELGEPIEAWLSSVDQSGVFCNGGFTRRVAGRLIRRRLDPPGYHPELRGIGELAEKSNGLFRPLNEVASIVTEQRPRVDFSSELAAYISILHVDDFGFIDMVSARENQPESSGRLCKSGDVLYSCINPSANRAGTFEGETGVVACSPEFSIILPNDAAVAHYLAFAIRSQPCLRQLIHLGHGTSSSRRRVDENELNNLWIPFLKNIEQTESQLADAQRIMLVAERSRTAAVLLADALFDGEFSEADLDCAHRSLQSGRFDEDRAILARLHEGGVDVESTRKLFPNLDEYYESLKHTNYKWITGVDE